MIIGDVRTFPNARTDKAQALKVLEEASEVFGAWQALDRAQSFNDIDCSIVNLVDECADLITATSNLLVELDIDDMRPAIKACEKRNVERGRYARRDG